MGHIQDERGTADHTNRVRSTRGTAGIGTCPPVLAVVVRKIRVDQLEGLALPVVIVAPAPPAMAMIVRAQLALGPIAFVGVLDPINGNAPLIDQLENLARIAQPIRPPPNDRAHIGVLGSKGVDISRDNEARPDPQCNIREGEIDSIGETPTRKTDGFLAIVD